MKEIIKLGACPKNEKPAENTQGNYYERSAKEAMAYLDQIKRVVGKEPPLTGLRVKTVQNGDTYHKEVVCYYTSTNNESAKYADRCYRERPDQWDSRALEDIGPDKYKAWPKP